MNPEIDWIKCMKTGMHAIPGHEGRHAISCPMSVQIPPGTSINEAPDGFVVESWRQEGSTGMSSALDYDLYPKRD